MDTSRKCMDLHVQRKRFDGLISIHWKLSTVYVVLGS